MTQAGATALPNVANPLLAPDRVEKLIKAAREAPVFFAFGFEAAPDRCVMAVDKAKAGKILFEICRKEAGSKKGAYGTVQLGDTAAVFTCEKDDAPTLAKAIQGYFKTHKINLRAEIAAAPDPEAEAGEDAPHAADAAREPSRDDEQQDEDDVPEGKIYDPATIIALIRRARTRAFPFAFGVAGDRPLLAVHPRMDPLRLARMVRSEGAQRGVWGTVSLDGSVAVFACEKDPFPGVKKGIRQWFKEQRLAARFRLHGPEGEFDDPEDLDSDAPIHGGGLGDHDFRAIASRWTAAYATAQTNLATFGERFLALSEVQTDPRLWRVREAVAELPDLIARFDAIMAQDLEAAAAGRIGAPELKKTLEQCRRELAGAGTLERLETFAQRATGQQLPMHSLLSRSLAELAEALS